MAMVIPLVFMKSMMTSSKSVVAEFEWRKGKLHHSQWLERSCSSWDGILIDGPLENGEAKLGSSPAFWYYHTSFSHSLRESNMTTILSVLCHDSDGLLIFWFHFIKWRFIVDTEKVSGFVNSSAHVKDSSSSEALCLYRLMLACTALYCLSFTS